MPQAAGNKLFYGDNLEILRSRIADESVDLIYLDPPFNSNRSYNVLFQTKSGEEAQAQIEAFDDTWTWSQQSESEYEELIQDGPDAVAQAVEAMRKLLGANDVMAYLVMMSLRLVEMHRVLKPTGSLYLHCDPTASHYLKIVLDAVFGPTQFRNEIIWRRTGTHGKVRRFGPIHDVILFFTKSADYKWNPVRKRYMKGHVEGYFVHDDQGWRTNYYGNVLTGSGVRGGESGQTWQGFNPTAKGRHWAIPGALVDELGVDLTGMSQHEKLDLLHERGFIKIVPGQAWPVYEHYISADDGVAAPDLWTYQPYTEGTVFGTSAGIDDDVRWLSPRDQERLGYPTQKPVGLLERIIRASSDEGDVVLDPFCGCGTTIDAAQKLGRQWVGVDISYLSIALIQDRLADTHGPSVVDEYTVVGIPRDLGGAEALFKANAFDFERWAVSAVGGRANQKQVGDKGIDGVMRFPIRRSQAGRVLISVKGGGQLNPAMVRDLRGTIEREKAEMGLLITLGKPTRGMIDEANHSGLYEYQLNGDKFPRIQLLTIGDILAGRRLVGPSTYYRPYAQATRAVEDNQLTMFGLEHG